MTHYSHVGTFGKFFFQPFLPIADKKSSNKSIIVNQSTKMTVLGFAAGLHHNGATLVLLFVLLSASKSGSGVVNGFPRTAFSPTTLPNTAMPFYGSTSRVRIGSRHRRRLVHTARQRRRHHDRYDEEDDDDTSTQVYTSGIPQLPAFQSHKTGPAAPALPQQPMVASRQFQLQYTCKVCETRNQHTVSRIAYRQGVVIARCKGCDAQHLIADHLGFTGGFPTKSSDSDFSSSNSNNNNNETRTATIEEHFADGVVNRVSKEVFDLERVLQGHDAKSGSIMGENGELAME